MKDENDNKTVDCFSSRHAVKQAERVIFILKSVMSKRGRTSIKDIQSIVNLSGRATTTLVNQLMTEGYLESNSQKPISLKATDKAKQLFGAQG